MTINFATELASVTNHWTPKVVGQVNNEYVKVAKLLGELMWHDHADEDEMFLVVYGQLIIQIEDSEDVVLNAGEAFVVPKGVRHNPIAHEEVGIVLIETVTTKHTGNEITDRTVSLDRQLGA